MTSTILAKAARLAGDPPGVCDCGPWRALWQVGLLLLALTRKRDRRGISSGIRANQRIPSGCATIVDALGDVAQGSRSLETFNT